MTEEILLKILCRACDRPLEKDTELLQSGYLDSLAMVLLEEELETAGEDFSVARIPREAMRTPQTLWEWYAEEHIRGLKKAMNETTPVQRRKDV